MIKKLIVLCIVMFSYSAFAQQGTASPYSFYGIGSLKFKGTVENRSMGGIGVYLDSIHVNLRNPASYASKNIEAYPFDNDSRPVKLAVAGTTTSTNLESNSGSASTGSSTFDYIAVTIPVGKVGFGFGLLPFTSVGYKLNDINNNGDLQSSYEGEGGLNRVFAGLGYRLNDHWSFGVDFNYNFGNVQNSAVVFEYNNEGEIVQFQTQEENRSDLSGLSLNFGASYRTMITEKLELQATLAYTPEANITSNNQRTISTVLFDDIFNNVVFVSQSEEIDLSLNNLEKTELTLPSRLAVGAGIGKPRKWFVGAEYTFQNTSSFSNPVFSNQDTSFENSSQIALGGFFIPNYDAFSGYFKRIVYRAGFNYANTGLVVKDESINEFGISFGVGLPVGARNLFSNANFGVEIGQRGTTNKNLVQENFVNFNISLSLNSRWFRQKKYN